MNSKIEALRQQYEVFARQYIDDCYQSSPLGEALHYAMIGQGKRVRPIFCMLSAQACGGSVSSALAPALATEMVHTYSLVHDDLPCMDDDDTRRGRPTVHKRFGVDSALLAGDGLLTDAFGVLARHSCAAISSACRLEMVNELAAAAGSRGMVRGQALDLYWTGRGGAGKADLDEIHLLKTGALLGAACALGALAAEGSAENVHKLRQFGQMVGLAFQIKDDVLDQMEGIGKTPGKDAEAGKLTYLSLMNVEQANAAADACTRRAIDLVETIGENGNLLIEFAQYLLKRSS